MWALFFGGIDERYYKINQIFCENAWFKAFIKDVDFIWVSTFCMKVAKNTWLRIPSLKAKASLRNS
mgnify:CR=1 FL=1